MATAITDTTRNKDSQPTRDRQPPLQHVLDHLTALGPSLADSIPGFAALFLVGAPALGDLPVLDLGDRLVAVTDVPLVLIVDATIPAPTLHCLAAGIGLHVGVRVRLHCFHRAWLSAQVPKRREGFELFAARQLLAGSEDCLRGLSLDWQRRPAPEAAENLLVSGLDLLLRSWPAAPMLARGPAASAAPVALVAIALAEVGRQVGDAMRLLQGDFACDAREQRQALGQAAKDDAERAIWDWAYGHDPLEGFPSMSSLAVWDALRGLHHRALAAVVEARTGNASAEAYHLLNHVRSCRRSWWSRLRRVLVEKQRGGGREYAQLELVLALALRPEGGEDRTLLAQAARLLPQLGGPILANPDWSRLRRETLLLRLAEQRSLGPLLAERA